MAKNRDKEGEPFIERPDRPTPIDYDKPLSDLTLRDLLSIIETQVAQAGASAGSASGVGGFGERAFTPLPEQVKPEQLKPEQLKPEQLKPEQLKPEQLKPEQLKPEQLKPEQLKPEQLKPEQFKPEQFKPELSKPEKPYTPIRSIRDLVSGMERDLLEGITVLEAERSRRFVDRSRVTVLNYDPQGEAEGLRLLLPGSVTLFVAPVGSPLLSQVAETFRRGGGSAQVEELIQQISFQAANWSRANPLQTARELAAGRVFANLSYHDETLVQNLGLPNQIGFGVISFPYIGTELDSEGFILDQYIRHDFQERLDAVAVVRAPVLTEAERAALDLVSPERREIGISTPGHLAVTVTTVTVALFVVAVHTPTLTGGQTIDELRGRLNRLSLSADRIARLKSPTTIGELVALRRELQAELF